MIKDGLKLEDENNKLIKHVSEDIVSKSKHSFVIAEELRKMNLK